jgi:hypothetical protein
MKILSRVVLLALNALISYFLINWGLYGRGDLTGDYTRVPWALALGILILPAIIFLLILGKSNKTAEQTFWYLGIGVPIFILLLLFGL